jgi:hypothetical protein
VEGEGEKVRQTLLHPGTSSLSSSILAFIFSRLACEFYFLNRKISTGEAKWQCNIINKPPEKWLKATSPGPNRPIIAEI